MLRRITRYGLAVVAALSLTLGLGVAVVPAQASPASGTASSYRHACATTVPAGYATCLAVVPDTARSSEIAPAQTAGAYGPADLQSAYNLAADAASRGGGETVAIVDAYNDPTAQADLNAYRSNYGLPTTTIKVLNQYGATSPLPPASGTSGWSIEESLDLDMVSAICPLCQIDLLEANSGDVTDLGTAVDSAAALPGVVSISNSYGGPESNGETSDDTYYDHPGLAITVSAGDNGYGVQYPAASRYVTAVGGTTLSVDPAAARGWVESVWGNESTEPGQGTGSGCSAYEPKASWQGSVSDPLCGNRTVADIAADADPATGVEIYDSYDYRGFVSGIGGTSVASPIIAAVYALAGSSNGSPYYPASYPYQHASMLYNVPTGSNGSCGNYLCQGGTGYNGPTGLGTPDGDGALIPGPPVPAAKITVKYVCGLSQSHYEWLVTNADRSVGAPEFWIKVNATILATIAGQVKRLWVASRSIAANNSGWHLSTYEGWKLGVYWMSNGFPPPPHEVGALFAQSGAPAPSQRIAC